MRQKNVWLIIFLATSLFFIACSNKKEDKKEDKKDEIKEETVSKTDIDSNAVEVAIPGINSWIGKYQYDEKPVESDGGYNMVMNWTLDIARKNDSLQGTLEVNGQQTFIKMITNIRGDGKEISVTFNRMVDGMDQGFTSNVVLFTLTHKDKTTITSFSAMAPRLSENPQKICECFLPAR